MARPTVEIDNVLCIHETPKAILVRLDDGDEHWLPKSVLADDSEVYENGHEGKLVIYEWFADQEGIG